jgi:DNA replication protein DnaC
MNDGELERLKRFETDRLLALDRNIPRRHFALLGIGCDPVGEVRDTAAMRAVREHHGGTLVLVGPVGTGKTVAGAGWCWQHRGLFVRAGELMRISWYQNAFIDTVMTVPALVIDDIGAEYGDTKGNWQAKIDEIIDTRYAAGDEVGTVLTSNKPLPELRALLGERAWDRLHECARFVVCDGPSMRKGGE